MKINEVLLKPLLTEKAINLAKNKVYCFYVNKKATKKQIKEVVEYLYSIKVHQIRTSFHKGKTKRIGRLRKEKKLSPLKIAYIKVKQGEINLFPTT